MPVSKSIRVKVGYAKMRHPDYLQFVKGVYKSVLENPRFPKLPVDLVVVKAILDEYESAVVAADDGSKTVLLRRNALRENLDKMVRQIAYYVEAASDNDESVFATSGFEALPTVRKSPQPMDTPQILKIAHGANSGLLVVSLSPTHRKVVKYELRYGPAESDPNTASWITSSIAVYRRPATIDNLTPGTVYAFQVRALGRLGFTDWSDPTTFMCT
jgi:hypothetical protein